MNLEESQTSVVFYHVSLRRILKGLLSLFIDWYRKIIKLLGKTGNYMGKLNVTSVAITQVFDGNRNSQY